MNVLHINKFHYMRGGSEAVYFRTADVLKLHGHKSLFFSMHCLENISCETSDFFMPYVDLVNNNGLMDQLKNAGRVLYSFEARNRLSHLLEKYPIDIAHLHNIHHQISPSILHELKKRNIPIVMTLHDYKMVCASYSMLAEEKPCEACCGGSYFHAAKKRCIKGSFVKSILATLEMYLHHKILDIYSNVDVFISPSLFLKNKLHQMGFNKEIVHLPNFIDTDSFRQIEDNKNLPENSIVYFGRLSEIKGLWTLIEAAGLLGSRSDVQVKIIGDGQLKAGLEYKVNSLSLKNVRFLGYMKGDELFKEIKNSLFVVLPSEWYENNPMSVLESFALGKPVIGSRIGGIPELVKDNKTGLTFEPGNAEDLCSKIECLINNKDLVGEMGRNARKFVERELNPEKYYQGLMHVYQLAGNKCKTPEFLKTKGEAFTHT
ncbi:MAG: hypothetical protein HW406_16 [Candidatus Brocadiaceae bacterium]|nr:hypothetical protein [Candidatus Brocadiaceae bacterium]